MYGTVGFPAAATPLMGTTPAALVAAHGDRPRSVAAQPWPVSMTQKRLPSGSARTTKSASSG